MCKSKKCDKCEKHFRLTFEDDTVVVCRTKDNQDVRDKVGLPVKHVRYATCHEYRTDCNQLKLDLKGGLCYGSLKDRVS